MASAIGNYVHLLGKNYEKSGTSMYGTEGGMSLSTAIAAQHELIQNQIQNYEQANNLSLYRLQNKINQLIKLMGSDKPSNNKGLSGEQVRQFLEQVMNEEFDNLQTLDFKTGSVKEIGGKGSRDRGRFKDPSRYKNWRKALVARVNQLNKILHDLEQQANESNDGVKIEEYGAAIDKLSTLLNDTYQKTWENISQTGLKVNKSTTQNLIKELNELIDKYAAMPAIDLQSGTFFENILQLIPQMADNEVDRVMFEKVGKGQDRLKVSYNQSTFASQLKGQKKFDEMIQTVKTSQGKIDVGFKWEGKDLNISAKNLDISTKGYKYISTVTDSPLIYLLQDANPSFVNHYLNIYSNHVDKKSMNSNLASQKSAIQDVMRLTLAYKGLTGDTYGRHDFKTNVFIVNDYTGKKSNNIRVISIYTLLNRMSKTNSSDLFVTNNVWNMYANKKVTGYPSTAKWERIGKIIQEMHDRKIRTSFHSKLLDTK